MLPPSRTLVKICGLSTPETVEAALDGGADMVGFVRFPRSPRHVEDVGRELSAGAKGRATRVLLVVDPDDAALEADIPAFDPDLIQLHGGETPERVAAIRERFARPVMKAVGIAGETDLTALADYADVADRILLDAKAPPDAMLPGGNGQTFDWTILARAFPSPLAGEGGLRVSDARMRGDPRHSALHPSSDPGSRQGHLLPQGEKGSALDPARHILSGGLTPTNVADALRISGLRAVDVSSGVETAPGRKDPALIRAFIEAARAASPTPQRAVA